MTEPEAITEARCELGKQLAASRKTAGYNQYQLAPLTGYSRSTIANAETGRQSPPRDFWERCDHALGTGSLLTAGFDEVEGARRRQRAAASRRAQAEREARVKQWREQSEISPSQELDDTGIQPEQVLGESHDESSELRPVLRALTARCLPLFHEQADGAEIGVAALKDMSLKQTADLLIRLFLQLDDELGGDAFYLPLSRYVTRLAVNAQREPTDGLRMFA